ncbi:MAG: AfsA-related hotdog domain-containing protein [Paenirhodobacter sp.]|uniref:AfsA-related hotdog domain-containing protein n=1 Tax=Paenirhodobacter sp. TaxID=1965326 RepID=UPI003D0B0CE3
MHLVTGNRFEDFSNAVGSLPASQVLARLSGEDALQDIVLGQGISDEERQILKLLVKACGGRVHDLAADDRRAGRSVCHKHYAQNQLISLPRPVGKDVFEADLLLDDRNEILSDHLTGCHLQGMLLVEATRQMFIAVGETQYPELDVPKDAYVVFDRIETRFETFAFPLPTVLRQTVTSTKTDRPGRVGFTAVVELTQPQGRVARSEVSYTIFDRAALQPKEEKLARLAVEAVMAQLGGTLTVAPVAAGATAQMVASV